MLHAYVFSGNYPTDCGTSVVHYRRLECSFEYAKARKIGGGVYVYFAAGLCDR
jgi:hypothetical protein